MSYLTPLTKDVIDIVMQELKKKETKNIIVKNVVRPVTNELMNKFSIYIILYFLYHLLILILLIYIVIKISSKSN